MKLCPSTTLVSHDFSRRQFLRSVAGLGLSAAGLALLNGCAGSPAAPGAVTEMLETTTIRLGKNPSICVAPLYVAEDLLKAEGFTSVQYIDNPGTDLVERISAGAVDIGMQFSAPMILNVDAGKPLTLLAGVHVGCFVLFGTERVNRIGDLKGQTLAVAGLYGNDYVFLSSMLAYVGLKPTTDVTWMTLPRPEAQQRLKDGKIAAFMAFPPAVEEFQAKKIGHMVVNSMVDKPWSEYFCCMVAGHQEFVQKNPVATKRALRAILNATDIVARAPERAAKLIVDRGFTTNYDYALRAMRDIPYNTWREYDPGDTLRFYALRLREAGMIKSTPDEIIAKSTDWRFLNELKQELPAPMPSVRNSGLLCHVGEPG